MNKKILNLIIILILLFIFFLFSSKTKIKKSSESVRNEPTKTEPVSTIAYDFELSDINGKKIKLSDFKDKVVILNFWATWCPPCRAEIPSFVELYKKYKNEGLSIIGVAIDNETKVKNFVKEFKINYPVLLADEITIQKYGGIRGIPTTFIIDKNGNIIKNYIGYRPKETFENDFKNLK